MRLAPPLDAAPVFSTSVQSPLEAQLAHKHVRKPLLGRDEIPLST